MRFLVVIVIHLLLYILLLYIYYYIFTGNVVNKPEHGSLDWVKICEKSSKVITFIDLAGHERYLKTTVFGMTGHAPDFGKTLRLSKISFYCYYNCNIQKKKFNRNIFLITFTFRYSFIYQYTVLQSLHEYIINFNASIISGMLMIGANAGIVGMTKEHLGLALALSVPVFVVVTKIDMCPPNVLQENLKLLIRILKSPGCRKVPVTVKTPDDVVVSATNFVSERLVL